MKSGIAIDDWKQPIFEDILTEAGWTYEVGPGVTPDTRMIHVEHKPEELQRLAQTVQKCQNKAAELKG